MEGSDKDQGVAGTPRGEGSVVGEGILRTNAFPAPLDGATGMAARIGDGFTAGLLRAFGPRASVGAVETGMQGTALPSIWPQFPGVGRSTEKELCAEGP